MLLLYSLQGLLVIIYHSLPTILKSNLLMVYIFYMETFEFLTHFQNTKTSFLELLSRASWIIIC